MPPRFIAGVNDMATTHPRLAAELVGTDPTTVMAGTGKTLLWKCPNHETPYPQTGRRRVEGIKCRYCSGDRVLAGFNDMATTHPNLAAELVATDPTTVTAHTHSTLLWRCLNHSEPYPSKGNDRANGRGCGYCAGKRVLAGFNDMATTHPDFAQELIGTDPKVVLASTTKKLTWRCPNHEAPYEATGEQRLRGNGCPYCPRPRVRQSAGRHKEPGADFSAEGVRFDESAILEHPKKLLPGFNDMATTRPDLAAELVGTDPTTVMAGTTQNLMWRCPNHDQPYFTQGKARLRGRSCPYCNGTHGVLAGFNDMATTHPELASELVGTDPTSIRASTSRRLLWRCPNHEQPFPATGQNRVAGWGCGFCANKQILVGYNDLASTHEDLARELVDLDPTKITSGSNSKQKWRCSACGHEWNAIVANRSKGSGCPKCNPGGFDPSMPGYLYLLERPGEQQIGITGDVNRRLVEHQLKGDWVLVDVIGPFSGEEVKTLERRLKGWLKKSIGTLQGTQENWSTACLEVRTIGQLIDKSQMSPL